MLRSLPSTIDTPDTLYEPNAVFSQFLGSASMVFFPFLSFLHLAVFLFRFVFVLSIVFHFLFLFFVLFSISSVFSFLFPKWLESGVRVRSDRCHV